MDFIGVVRNGVIVPESLGSLRDGDRVSFFPAGKGKGGAKAKGNGTKARSVSSRKGSAVRGEPVGAIYLPGKKVAPPAAYIVDGRWTPSPELIQLAGSGRKTSAKKMTANGNVSTNRKKEGAGESSLTPEFLEAVRPARRLTAKRKAEIDQAISSLFGSRRDDSEYKGRSGTEILARRRAAQQAEVDSYRRKARSGSPR